jgi:hypothetical protein
LRAWHDDRSIHRLICASLRQSSTLPTHGARHIAVRPEVANTTLSKHDVLRSTSSAGSGRVAAAEWAPVPMSDSPSTFTVP